MTQTGHLCANKHLENKMWVIQSRLKIINYTGRWRNARYGRIKKFVSLYWKTERLDNRWEQNNRKVNENLRLSRNVQKSFPISAQAIISSHYYNCTQYSIDAKVRHQVETMSQDKDADYLMWIKFHTNFKCPLN